MVKLPDDVLWENEAIKIMEKLNPYDVYLYHKMFFDKLSDLQLFLINHGYDINLVSGRLLSAYRDQGVSMPLARLFTAFMLWDEQDWIGDHPQDLWNLIMEFIDRDEIIYLKPKQPLIPPYILGASVWVSKSTPGVHGGDGFKICIGVKGFDDFPVHNVDVSRYQTPPEDIQQKYPHLMDTIVESGAINSFSVTGEYNKRKVQHRCKKEWLVNRSQVFLYRSPFWTMDENYIESYLEVRYGSDWNIPIPDLMEWMSKEKDKM